MKFLDKERLRYWNPKDFKNSVLEQEKILDVFKLLDAYWYHDGNPNNPHAELTSGLCSNGYFNCPEVLCYPNLCEILGSQLALKIGRKIDKHLVDIVVGSSYSDITFSYEVAKALGAIHRFAEKDKENPKMQVFKKQIPEGSNVLQVEELVTTSNTFSSVKNSIIEKNKETVSFFPYIATLVHRPPEERSYYLVNGAKIEVISLVEKVIWAKDPSECPLCKQGSRRYRPKENWDKLTDKE